MGHYLDSYKNNHHHNNIAPVPTEDSGALQPNKNYCAKIISTHSHAVY